MYAPRRWALKKRSLFVLGKVFRDLALSLFGLFGLLRSWLGRRERVPRRWAGLDDRKPGSNHTFVNR